MRGYGNDWAACAMPCCRASRSVVSAPCTGASLWRRWFMTSHQKHGGTDDYDNLQPLCNACHDIKTTQEVERGRLQKVSSR